MCGRTVRRLSLRRLAFITTVCVEIAGFSWQALAISAWHGCAVSQAFARRFLQMNNCGVTARLFNIFV